MWKLGWADKGYRGLLQDGEVVDRDSSRGGGAANAVVASTVSRTGSRMAPGRLGSPGKKGASTAAKALVVGGRGVCGSMRGKGNGTRGSPKRTTTAFTSGGCPRAAPARRY